MPRRISEENKERILNEYRTSGLSQKKISMKNNISLQTLQIWLRKEKSKQNFDFISLSKNNIDSNNFYNRKKEVDEKNFNLEFPSGINLKIPLLVEPKFLIEILRSFQ